MTEMMDRKKSPKSKGQVKKPYRRRTAVLPQQLMGKLLDRSMRQRGFAQTEIITRWPEIVGLDIARTVMPVRLKMPPGSKMGGTLEVRTESAYALILQHREHYLLERINSFYGFAAVARLSIIHGPVLQKQGTIVVQAEELDKETEKRLKAMLKPVEQSDLAAALDRLGREVIGRK